MIEDKTGPVEAKIIKVEEEIRDVEKEIRELMSIAGPMGSGLNDFQRDRYTYLTKKEGDLRKKEEDLRKKEEELRKLLLLQSSSTGIYC